MDSIPPHMRPERSFQGLILALQRYWADYGCVVLQPYDMEVGAGTFHPATTLRALGPRWPRTALRSFSTISSVEPINSSAEKPNIGSMV